MFQFSQRYNQRRAGVDSRLIGTSDRAPRGTPTERLRSEALEAAQ